MLDSGGNGGVGSRSVSRRFTRRVGSETTTKRTPKVTR
jgi:hypothetical protein